MSHAKRIALPCLLLSYFPLYIIKVIPCNLNNSSYILFESVIILSMEYKLCQSVLGGARMIALGSLIFYLPALNESTG